MSEHKKHDRPVGFETGCKYCGRDEELRFGGCFECADMESIFIDGEDMWDNDYSDWKKSEVLAYIIRKSMSLTPQPQTKPQAGKEK